MTVLWVIFGVVWSVVALLALCYAYLRVRGWLWCRKVKKHMYSISPADTPFTANVGTDRTNRLLRALERAKGEP